MFLYSSFVYFFHLFLVYSALLNHKIPKSQSDLEKKEQSLRPWLLTSNILESYSNQNRMICFWLKNRYIDQQSRTTKPERNAHHILLVSLWKRSQEYPVGKGQAFQNGPGKTWLPYDIMELYPCLLPYNYINYKGIKKLNIKTRAIKPLEEDIELFFLPLVFAVSFWVSTKSKGNNCQNKQVEPHQTPKKGTSTKPKGNLQVDRRYFQIIYLIRA